MPKATRKPKNEVRRQSKHGQPLTAREKRELADIPELPDDQIDTSDIPRAATNCMEGRSPGKVLSAHKAGGLDAA
jgi:hypothetical protein